MAPQPHQVRGVGPGLGVELGPGPSHRDQSEDGVHRRVDPGRFPVGPGRDPHRHRLDLHRPGGHRPRHAVAGHGGGHDRRDGVLPRRLRGLDRHRAPGAGPHLQLPGPDRPSPVHPLRGGGPARRAGEPQGRARHGRVPVRPPDPGRPRASQTRSGGSAGCPRWGPCWPCWPPSPCLCCCGNPRSSSPTPRSWPSPCAPPRSPSSPGGPGSCRSGRWGSPASAPSVPPPSCGGCRSTSGGAACICSRARCRPSPSAGPSWPAPPWPACWPPPSGWGRCGSGACCWP